MECFKHWHDELFKRLFLNYYSQIRNEKVTEASHRVNDQIAQVGAVHTRTEKLIKVCMVDTAECLLDEKSVKKKENHSNATYQWCSVSSN